MYYNSYATNDIPLGSFDHNPNNCSYYNILDPEYKYI